MDKVIGRLCLIPFEIRIFVFSKSYLKYGKQQ